MTHAGSPTRSSASGVRTCTPSLFSRTTSTPAPARAGMPHVYYGLLVQLAEAPQRRLRMTELAMRAKITRSRLSHAVARLEKNGWVRREDCPSDKRGQLAVLTHQGYAVLSDTAPGHVAAVRQALFDRLTPEQQKSLGEIMSIIARVCSPRRRAPTCPGCAEPPGGSAPTRVCPAPAGPGHTRSARTRRPGPRPWCPARLRGQAPRAHSRDLPVDGRPPATVSGRPPERAARPRRPCPCPGRRPTPRRGVRR